MFDIFMWINFNKAALCRCKKKIKRTGSSQQLTDTSILVIKHWLSLKSRGSSFIKVCLSGCVENQLPKADISSRISKL